MDTCPDAHRTQTKQKKKGNHKVVYVICRKSTFMTTSMLEYYDSVLDFQDLSVKI